MRGRRCRARFFELPIGWKGRAGRHPMVRPRDGAAAGAEALRTEGGGEGGGRRCRDQGLCAVAAELGLLGASGRSEERRVGKSVSVSVEPGGRRIIKKKTTRRVLRDERNDIIQA